jgi:hypothetical protein
MNLLPAWCPECKLYLGLQDGHGEVPKTFLMPHLPGCRAGDQERAALEDEARATG